MNRRLLGTLAVPWVAVIALSGPVVHGQMGRPGANAIDQDKWTEIALGGRGGTEPEISPAELSILEKVDVVAQSNLEYGRNMLEDIVSIEGRVNPVFHHALGSIYFRLDQREEAARQFEIAVRRFPAYLRAWNELGALRFANDDFEGATAALAKSIQLGASDSGTYGMLGYCHLQNGSFAAAGTAYDLALMGDPKNVTWLEGKTSVLIGMERYGEVDSLLRELIRRDPENLQYWLLQANAMISKGENFAAIRSLEIARRIGTIGNEALLLLGNIYLAQNMTGEAAEIYAEALDEAVSMSVDMAMKAAGLMLSKGEIDTARKIVEVYQPDADSGNWSVEERSRYGMVVAGLFLRDGDINGAIGQLSAVLDNDPFNDHVLYRLAECHLLKGEREGAGVLLERVSPESKDGYNAALLWSRLLIEDEAYVDAARVLQQALSSHPDEALAEFLNQVETATEERRLLGLTVD